MVNTMVRMPESNGKMESDITVYDPTSMMWRIIHAVKIASPYHDPARDVSFVGAKDRHSRVSPETIARKFRCGLETAQKTLKSTTQRGVRHAIHPLHRRYRVDHLNLNRRRLNDTFYMDTLFSKVKSLGGYTCAQLITNGKFTRVYPMESKASSDIAHALGKFAGDVGIPDTLICDLAIVFTSDYYQQRRDVVPNKTTKLKLRYGR